jgi:hypothetical protein
MEFYSALRRNETTWFECKLIQLDNIRLSEGRQVQEDKGHMLSFICGK